jgi:hypothetical protein
MWGKRLKRVLQLVELVAALAIADEVPIDGQFAAVDLLQVVDAAQECALARSRRSDEAQDLAPTDGQVDALQYLEAPVGLVDLAGLDHGDGWRPRIGGRRRDVSHGVPPRGSR